MLLGIAAGVAAATTLSAWVLLLAPLDGSRTVGRVSPISAQAAVGAYFAALPAVGAVAGLLWPLGRSRLGAALGGTLGALVLYGSIEAAKGELLPMTAMDAVLLGVLALVIGVPAGLGYREMFGARRRPRRRRPGRDASTPPAS